MFLKDHLQTCLFIYKQHTTLNYKGKVFVSANIHFLI